MLELYIIRHARAGHADPAVWPDDAERPLTEDGISRFREAARGLRRLVPTVDVVLSSGFARAWQTAELLHEVARWPEPTRCAELEVGRTPASAAAVLADRTERSVAVVGHEPHLSRLASLLCAGSEDEVRLELKKGAVAFLGVDGTPGPGTALLHWAVPPKILSGLAPSRDRPPRA
jgi:phosphohistidine phosphatase